MSAASCSPPATGPVAEPVAGKVAVLTLGCARNEVDSEELAARLAAGGWDVGTDGTAADVVLVNTCGFIDQAKQESIDTLLAAAASGVRVVATGCLAERYGRELAASLPEVDAVLSFDQYPQISTVLAAVVAGQPILSHQPVDRRRRLPLRPVQRSSAPLVDEATPAHLRQVLRRRLTGGPVASLKLASGCDRRCAFCAIPSFRGAFVSRVPDELLAEAHWLAGTGVRELVLVSENSTSYGKDLGDPRLLEKLLPQLAAVPGIGRVRVSYLQPAEVRPGLITAIATTPGVAAYFDLSFQHASEPVLRRMRRFGSTRRFLDLLAAIRTLEPQAGARSNVIVGFPGERVADVRELESFLDQARLDAIGVFDYSDEAGTEAAGLPGKVGRATIARRYQRLSALAEELCAQRAAERVGTTIEVLVEQVDGLVEGRAAHQAPEVDGATTLVAPQRPDGDRDLAALRPGDLVRAVVTGTDGVDLEAVPTVLISPAAAPGQVGASTGQR